MIYFFKTSGDDSADSDSSALITQYEELTKKMEDKIQHLEEQNKLQESSITKSSKHDLELNKKIGKDIKELIDICDSLEENLEKIKKENKILLQCIESEENLIEQTRDGEKIQNISEEQDKQGRKETLIESQIQQIEATKKFLNEILENNQEFIKLQEENKSIKLDEKEIQKKIDKLQEKVKIGYDSSAQSVKDLRDETGELLSKGADDIVDGIIGIPLLGSFLGALLKVSFACVKCTFRITNLISDSISDSIVKGQKKRAKNKIEKLQDKKDTLKKNKTSLPLKLNKQKDFLSSLKTKQKEGQIITTQNRMA